MLNNLIDYDYYTKQYGGSSIPESSFNKESIKASSRVNYYTKNRINEENINDDIKNATCEIADFIYSQDTLKENVIGNNSDKASETVGPHSVTYINKSSIQDKHILSDSELDKECYQICLRQIGYTGLMYRGVY